MPFIGAAIGAIGSALGAVGSFIGGLGAFGKLAIGIGLNIASAALLKKKNNAALGADLPRGVVIQHEFGGDVGRKVACGLVGVAGHDVHVNTFGPSNGTLQQVYVLSDYPSDGLSRVAINGTWATLDFGNPDYTMGYPVTSGDFAGKIWVKFIDGNQDAGEGDTGLVNNANPPERWTLDHAGVGTTYAIVTMEYDAEKLNSFPDFFFEFRGARCYDWRKDSTAGGSGSHRWNDRSTHEFTSNPIVIGRHYMRGFSINGDLFCGMDVPSGDLPLSKWTAAANLCDESVEGEPRYRVSIMLDCMATHGDNIESLLLSCGGMMIDGVDGHWPLVGSDQPIVATLTDDDLAADAPVRFRAKRSMGELVNSVTGTSLDPEQMWAMTDYPSAISSGAVVLDRRDRDVPIDFPQVPSKRQAGQLASIYLEENRFEATATATFRPRWQVLEAGDWIRWNSARYGNRVYLVTEILLVSLDGEGPRNAQLTLQERDGSIYDGIANPSIVLPYPPGEPVYATEAENFQAAEIEVEEPDGGLRPGILVTWNQFTDVTVTGMLIRYWPTLQPDKVFTKIVPRSQTQAVLTEGVVSRTQYKVQHEIITAPPRTTVFSAPLTVTTSNAPSSDILAYLRNIGADTRALIKIVADRYENEFRPMIEQLALDTALGAGSNKKSMAAIVKTGRALAASVLQLEAMINDDETGLSALATAVLGVEAQVDNLAAGGRISFRAQIPPPAGVLASIEIMARASDVGAFIETGMIIQVYLDGVTMRSRIVLVTDKLVITDGTLTGLPFVFESGRMTLNAMWAKTITAARLQSPDGLSYIDMTTGTIDLRV